LLICDVLGAEHYNWCTIPLSGYDVIVFGAMAVVFSCLFPGKYSTTITLIIGASH
jgi:hypothetical protein